MSITHNIAVDVMGGDFAPEAIIQGIALALKNLDQNFRYLLVGDQEKVTRCLEDCGIDPQQPRLEIIHAEEVIGMDEHPIVAVRHKRRSSINVAADLVKRGEAEGLFSAGNTGASVGSTFIKWRMLQGIERPALVAPLPREDGKHFQLIDAGATVDCSPLNLAQFAVMGDIYCKLVCGLENPTIGLLSNGTEEGKGNRVTQEAFTMIKSLKNLNFVGNVEGHDLFKKGLDVVIADGFVGNIVLKIAEQEAKVIGRMIKDSMKSNLLWSMGGMIAKGAFQTLKDCLDPSEIGGAPLLGVNGVCLIGHGVSDARAVQNGLRAVVDIVNSGLNAKIIEQIHEYGLDELVQGI